MPSGFASRIDVEFGISSCDYVFKSLFSPGDDQSCVDLVGFSKPSVRNVLLWITERCRHATLCEDCETTTAHPCRGAAELAPKCFGFGRQGKSQLLLISITSTSYPSDRIFSAGYNPPIASTT